MPNQLLVESRASVLDHDLDLVASSAESRASELSSA